MAAVCAAARAGVVLMHSRGDVADMATFAHATYGDDPVGEVVGELRDAVELRAAQRALAPSASSSIRASDSRSGASSRVAVLRHLARVAALGHPVLVGVSRKRFIGEITGVTMPAGRVDGSVGASVAALANGRAVVSRARRAAASRRARRRVGNPASDRS